jgi:glyceraldehyde-3-phosphate dehydrogenase (NADP+)
MTAAAVSIAPTTVIEPPGGAFIAGQWQTTKLPVAVRNPENGEHVGWVARSSRADVDRAVTALRHGLGREWPLYRRRAALTEASFLLAAQAERFARLISTEGCRTVVEAEREVTRAVETLRLSGECADALTGETLPLDNTERGAGRIGWFVRAPVGIVAAITPFNDPLNLVAHKLGPALLAGNGVILKPHEATPLTALAFAEVLIEAGVPGDRLAVVCGEAETGGHVVTHQQVDVISFTGGSRTGARISAMAGPRRLLMELGGNNPTLVCADADPTAAAAAIVEGAFGVAGQNCLSVQRVYIARELFDLVSAAVVAKTRALVVGSKRSRRTQVGPMINEGEARRVEEWVADAVAQGAEVLAGGTRNGSLHTPTVLADVPDGARIAVEEVFGPVVCLFAFDTVEEAIDRANSTHALHAGVFTRDIDAALRISGRLVAGAVLVNDTSDYRIDAMPFGGFGRSGIGREGIKHAIEAMTEPKSYIVKSISGNHAEFAERDQEKQ